MTFDPFGDFATRGYLQNLEAEKDPEIVRRLEHFSFTSGLDEAFSHLAKKKHLSYDDVLKTHRILFEAFYPWAGQDRLENAPTLAIKKGNVFFARPEAIRRTIDYALQKGQDKAFMVAKPGEIMGYLAYGHPFLDGNGRTIMVVHSVLAQRAGFSIDWASTNKTSYLDALSKEIEDPGKGLLDKYLKPFISTEIAAEGLGAGIAAAPGLDGDSDTTVAGRTNDPALKARYEQQEIKRKQAQE